MAELRKIKKSSPLSNFSQVGPEGGSAFIALADVARQGYEMLSPALDAAERQYGAELARRQIGQTNYPIVPKAQPHTAAGDLGSFSPDSGAFPASLVETESGGRWNALNDEMGAGGRGHGGRLQFGTARLQDASAAGIIRPMTPQEFAQQPPSIQAAVETWHFGDIDRQARARGLDKYIGQEVGGALITQDGIRAMAHLGGIGGAEQYLRSGGAVNPADANGTSLRDYAIRHAGMTTAQEAGVDVGADRLSFVPDVKIEDSAAEVLAPETPPTLVRTKEGKIEPRSHSPLAEGIMLATSAAAQTAYLSEMLSQGGIELQALSQNFAGDPAGFQQAAQSYIDQAVKSAPAMMRGDIRGKMSHEAQRRYLGVMGDHQQEVRQRANNSSRALYERYSTDYAEALAAGNFDEAASLRGNLEEVLTARESLPGVAWTREQSENIILNAQDAAATLREQNRAKVAKEQAGTLRTIISAAEEGRAAADEAILDDPNVIAANPELAAEAAAKVALRDAMPGFFALPPSEMDAMIADERAQPVTEGWEVDLLTPMEEARDLAIERLNADPIAYAQERLPQKPPAIDAFSPEDPSGFVSSLKARRDYGNEMVDAGFVDSPAFLSDSEIEAMSAVMSKDSPPEVRAAVAGALVQGFGEDAPQVFKALKVDGVTAWGGSLMAKGGSGSIAAEALRGQALIDAKQVQLPPEKEWRTTVQSGFRAVLADLPVDSIQAEAQVLKFAKAIYASRASAPGFEADENSMKDAIQTAMGQTTNPRGEVVGGVQELFGKQTLMPVGVNGERAQRAIQQGLVGGAWEQFGSIFGGDEDRAPAFWDKIGGGQPLIGGEPLPTNMVTGGEVRFVPMGGTRYRMEVQRSSAVMDVHTPDGSLYIVDFARL